jgi:ABC-type methionine transport system ATPase subunit
MPQKSPTTAGLSPAFALEGVRQESGGVRILDDLTLDIPEGAVTALIGPSGAGKSSLLRLLNRLDDPVAGIIRYRGRPLCDLPVREHRRRVGFVFQTPIVFPGSVRDNLTVAAEIAQVPPEEIEPRVRSSLDLAEVHGDLVDRDSSRLSVGQKQRVNVARVLMTGPEVLLLDEPAASLDPETAEKLMGTIARLSADHGITVVAATHRLTDARDVSAHTVMLDGGRLVEAGPTVDLFERSSHPRIRSFLESLR